MKNSTIQKKKEYRKDQIRSQKYLNYSFAVNIKLLGLMNMKYIQGRKKKLNYGIE